MTVLEDRARRIRGAVEKSGERYRSLLEALVRIESPSTDPDSQDPAFHLLGSELTALGFEARRLSGSATGGQLYARPRRARAASGGQLLLGHVDTVWPLGTLEEMPVRIQDGKLHGPGSFDMKGGLAQILVSLEVLRELDLEPEVEPVVFINSDEEIGSSESEARIRRLARAVCRTFVLEPALGRDARIKTTRRGTGRFAIRVIGKRAHTGLAPEEGASAIQELSHVIQSLHALTDRHRGVEVNVGQIQGGVRANVVAPEASAVVDVRVRTLEDAHWVTERIRELRAQTPGTRIEIDGSVGRAPLESTPRNRLLWRAAYDAGKALGLELEEGMSGGASDGNITSEYTATLDGLGPVGDGAHALHEFVDLERTLERTALLALLILLPGRLS